MANIQHLIAALGQVANAYAPYAPDPNDDDSDLNGDDPGNDAGNPNDDPRSYPDHDDDPNNHDDDDEDDFSRPKPFRTLMLLARLEQQAEFQGYKDRKLAARQRRIGIPLTNLEQKNKKLKQLRRKAAEVEQELKLNKRLEVESMRLQKANVALYRANMPVRDRIELEANTDRIADWASRHCKEAANDWREQATAAFGKQYQPPVHGHSPKQS
jgi:hypothetical protein